MNIQNRLADLVDYANALQRDTKSLGNDELMSVVSEDYKRSLKARAMKNWEEIRKAHSELTNEGVNLEKELGNEETYPLIRLVVSMMTVEVR